MKFVMPLLVVFSIGCARCTQNPVAEAPPPRQPMFSIEIPPGDSPVMLSVESFEPEYVLAYSQVLRALDDAGRRVVVRINTNGGRIDGFMNLSQTMEDMRQPVICVADWRAYSSGVFLLESPGCGLRLMTKRCTLYFHEVLDSDFAGNAHEMLREAERLNTLTTAVIASTAERMQMSEADLSARINDRDWLLSYREALQVHAVDGIAEAGKLPTLIRITKNY